MDNTASNVQSQRLLILLLSGHICCHTAPTCTVGRVSLVVLGVVAVIRIIAVPAVLAVVLLVLRVLRVISCPWALALLASTLQGLAISGLRVFLVLTAVSITIVNTLPPIIIIITPLGVTACLGVLAAALERVGLGTCMMTIAFVG